MILNSSPDIKWSSLIGRTDSYICMMKHILLRLTGNIFPNIRFYWFIKVFEETACFSTVRYLVNSCSFTASFKDCQLIAVSLRLLPVLTHLLPALWRWHPTDIRPGQWRCHQVQNSHQGSPFILNSHFVITKKLLVMRHLNILSIDVYLSFYTC